MHNQGIATPKHPAEALAWYRKSAGQGYVLAESMLGSILTDSKTSAVEGVMWLREAAKAGDAAAHYNLSRAYRLGIGVALDNGQGMYWLRKSAKQGNAAGLNGLGYAILIGMDGTYDFVQASSWLILAVERSGPGEVHDRALVNLRNARAQLSAAEWQAAELRADAWRQAFAAKEMLVDMALPGEP